MNTRGIAVEYAAETVISSAQNHEDVLLFRTFKGRRNGFYVDVGAGDPNWDSVTNWFYRIGWRGINIEANPMFRDSYAIYRPGDINLDTAISDAASRLSFNKVEQNSLGHGWGLSSLEPDARTRAEELGFEVTTMELSTCTLASVLDAHATGLTIDFLKVDVEGHEGAVLRSNDWIKHRPLVVCVESVEPNSAQPAYHDWQDVLLGARYEFALFDGVNDYYVREESLGLKSQLNAAVNCNDRFRRITLEDVAPV